MTDRSAATASHHETQAAFDRLYTRIAQRLEQNEALLDGLVALLRAVPDPGFEHLRRYSTEILSRYPHIHTVGYQLRVWHAQRGEFEQRMSALLGREYMIRDYSIEGDRTWRVAPPRAFYYPATFMAPEVAGAQDVIGYDGYGDALFRAAIDGAGSDDRGVATLPFDLIEGGRGYVFLRAFDLEESEPAQPGAHVVSLLVRADRLIDGEPMPAGARVELRRRDADNSAQAVVAAARGAAGAAANTTWLRRAVPSVQQPFEFCLETTAAPAPHSAFEDLGASIAHELNQPLAAMVGYSQAALRLLDPSTGASPVREALQAGIEQALRASELIRRLRSLVRQRTLRFESLPLRQVIDSAIRQDQAAIDSAGITMTTRWPQAAAEVQGDALLLAQLFGNLLRNAVQAVEASAQRPACIAIVVEALESHWRVAVSDSGPGLDAVQRSRAFQPVASAKPQGLGIGLAVCATIAEAHGGTIALEDAPETEPGLRGARFVVMLPRVAPEQPDNDTHRR